MAYNPVLGVRRYQSSAYVLAAIGFGLPLIFAAAAVGWVAALGYPQFIPVALLLVCLGLRGVYVSARGGVDVATNEITIRAWFRIERISIDSLRAVVGRRTANTGQVAGWLVTGDGNEHRLRGATSFHRHGTGHPCSVCAEEEDAIATIASSLGLPLLDGGTWSPYLPARQ